jgi:hypothetical protein
LENNARLEPYLKNYFFKKRFSLVAGEFWSYSITKSNWISNLLYLILSNGLLNPISNSFIS